MVHRRALLLGAAGALVPGGMAAHHQPGHGTPPGQGTTPPGVVVDPITGVPLDITQTVIVTPAPTVISGGRARRKRRRRGRRR